MTTADKDILGELEDLKIANGNLTKRLRALEQDREEFVQRLNRLERDSHAPVARSTERNPQ